MKRQSFEEAEAILEICAWIDRVEHMMTSEAAHDILRKKIREIVVDGKVPIGAVVQAADRGLVDADIILRAIVADMLDRPEAMPAELRAWARKAIVNAPAMSPGRSSVDTFQRDLGIAAIVSLTSQRWNVPVNRNRSSKRPSACSMVSAALVNRKHNVGEAHVERIARSYANGGIAKKLSALIPLQ
ncbi:hypothetical protein NKI12_08140 [Mesorhizobium australicum]|uniref:Uncharacterized protein n=1 Tax=Mesorhizobium australicum TaxID=536018 RepID=A0ACC6STV8_9HYPH